MIGLYILAAVVGLPLVAYAVLSGDGDGDFGELELETEGFGGDVFGYLSLGTLSFFSGFFGLTGLAVGAVGTGTIGTLAAAIVVGLIAAIVHRGLIGYVKSSSTSSHLSDTDFTGKVAKVVLPIEPGKRGRIALEFGSERQYLTAELPSGPASVDDAPIDAGSSVVIVDMAGGVALVSHLDPELT
ncbi:MAG: hypothetical protein AAF962_26670 [Actinomycetota bacterium]